MPMITYSRQHVASDLDRIHEIKRVALRPRYRWAKSTLIEVMKKQVHGRRITAGKSSGICLRGRKADVAITSQAW